MAIKNIPRHVSVILGEATFLETNRLFSSKEDSLKKFQFVTLLIESACAFPDMKFLSIDPFNGCGENLHFDFRNIEFIKDLMLFFQYLKSYLLKMKQYSIRIKCIGRLDQLDRSIQDLIQSLEQETQENQGLTIHLAINYSSRAEIIDLIKKNLSQERLFEKKLIVSKEIDRYLSSCRPDIDLLLLLSSRRSLEDFMLWHVSYAEIVFSDVFWTNFSKKHFFEAVREYQLRSRRFGAVVNGND